MCALSCRDLFRCRLLVLISSHATRLPSRLRLPWHFLFTAVRHALCFEHNASGKAAEGSCNVLYLISAAGRRLVVPASIFHAVDSVGSLQSQCDEQTASQSELVVNNKEKEQFSVPTGCIHSKTRYVRRVEAD